MDSVTRINSVRQKIADWRRAAPVDCSDDLEAEAQAAAEKLEAEYDNERLAALAQSGGRAC